jgi:soluble lytic murein transglycosylase-like protein
LFCLQNLAPLITAEASAQGVPPEIALQIAQQESGMCHWNADGSVKRGSAGEIGVMQIMPSTAPGVNLFDVNANIHFGMGYLASLYQQFGDWNLAAAAYNWGPSRVAGYVAGQREMPSNVTAYAAGATSKVPSVYDSSGAGYLIAAGDVSSTPAGAVSVGGMVWAGLGAAAVLVAVLA